VVVGEPRLTKNFPVEFACRDVLVISLAAIAKSLEDSADNASQDAGSEMIGPSLPPHLRKQIDEDVEKHSEDTPSSNPDAPAPKPSSAGPQLPPHLLAAREAKRKRKLEETETPESQPSPPQKRKPSPVSGSSMSGPTMPGHTMPSTLDDSDSDTEVGPSMSAMMTPGESAEYTRNQAIQRLSRTSPQTTSSQTKEAGKLQRDSWMLAPPTRSDWLNTLDASKLKARTFNQSKSGLVQSGQADHTEWTETPAERAQRIEDQVLGRTRKPAVDPEEERRREEEEGRDRKIKELVKKSRGPSLMEKHVAGRKDGVGEVDDPSKRAFDYQKDIAGGTLGFKERSAMISRAKDLESKYSGGKYL